MSDQTSEALDAARGVVSAMIQVHQGYAIGAMLGALSEWAVMNGGAETFRGSLNRALKLVDDLEREHRRRAS